MSAYQGSKKKAKQADAGQRIGQRSYLLAMGQRLQLMEAVVGKLLERENLAIGIRKDGTGLDLVDEPETPQIGLQCPNDDRAACTDDACSPDYCVKGEAANG